MQILVRGVRGPQDIRAAIKRGATMVAIECEAGRERYVPLIASQSGLLPDYATPLAVCTGGAGGSGDEAGGNDTLGGVTSACPALCGFFADEMPQTIVTRVYNHRLGWVFLEGGESDVMVSNLRRTLHPDIMPGVRIVKALPLSHVAVREAYEPWQEVCDALLLTAGGVSLDGEAVVSLLAGYHGRLPLFIECGRGDEATIKAIAAQQGGLIMGVCVEME